jgi:GTPase
VTPEIKEITKSEDFNAHLEEVNSQMAARQDNDVRVAVIGNVDSGKSTMVGVLTKCIMDDGRGSARQKVFNFSHEAANGRTSSIGQEIMGFDKDMHQVKVKEHQTANKN